MRRVCAWCQKDLGEKEPLDNKTLTHGLCKECGDIYFKGDEEEEINNENNKLKKT